MDTAVRQVNDFGDGLARLDWDVVAEDLHAKGFSHVKGVFPDNYCEEFISLYDRPEIYRKKVTMARHRFGLGEYKYFSYPLPDIVQTIREVAYPKLAPVANAWAEQLKIDVWYPSAVDGLQKLCRDAGQTKPTPLILKYGEGGFNTLHQDLYGEVYFPIQLAFFLNEPGKDYTGGEFVMTEQVPRAQSKPIVRTPRRGDMIVFTTNLRPVKGVRGYYRAAMKHGVSEVLSGVRHTLGVIFHDAVN